MKIVGNSLYGAPEFDHWVVRAMTIVPDVPSLVRILRAWHFPNSVGNSLAFPLRNNLLRTLGPEKPRA